MRLALTIAGVMIVEAALIYLFLTSLPAGSGHSISIGHSLVVGTTP